MGQEYSRQLQLYEFHSQLSSGHVLQNRIDFFKIMITKKAKFLSGPFTSMIFEILERQKNKLKILVGNIVTTISDKKNYLYRPV